MYVCAHNPVLELNKNFNIGTKINGMYCVLTSSANTHILSISRFLGFLKYLQTSKQLLWSRKYNYCKLRSLLKYEMNSTLSYDQRFFLYYVNHINNFRNEPMLFVHVEKTWENETRRGVSLGLSCLIYDVVCSTTFTNNASEIEPAF